MTSFWKSFVVQESKQKATKVLPLRKYGRKKQHKSAFIQLKVYISKVNLVCIKRVHSSMLEWIIKEL